jgi:hypothetical protein
VRQVVEQFGHRRNWERYVVGVYARWLLWDALGAWTGGRGRITTSGERQTTVALPDPPFGALPPEVRSTQVLKISGPAMIEPEFGHIITRPARVPQRIMIRSELARSRRGMWFFSGVPSARRYLQARLGRYPTRRFAAVGFLRQPFDSNYYHALVEVLPRLALLEQQGLPPDLPLVISKELANTPFFQAIMHRGALAERCWIVQDQFYVEADTVYAPRIRRDDRASLDRLLDLVDVPAPDRSSTRRLFLTRPIGKGRALTNMEALRLVLDRHQFEIIDTAALTLDEQIELFRTARVTIGIHGAGFTNVLFRRGAPLTMIEIFPPHDTDPGFWLLAESYGYEWDYLRGEGATGSERHADFALDPRVLDERLSALA